MAASIAIVNASEADCPMISKFTFGRWKAGSELLIVYKSPMVFAFHGRNFTITIPAITAIRDPWNLRPEYSMIVYRVKYKGEDSS